VVSSTAESGPELSRVSSDALIVRLPSGTEFWYAAKVPEVGDAIFRRGIRYVVTSSERSDDDRPVVTLEIEAPVDAVPVSPPA
jgi:hypothetical protein